MAGEPANWRSPTSIQGQHHPYVPSGPLGPFNWRTAIQAAIDWERRRLLVLELERFDAAHGRNENAPDSAVARAAVAQTLAHLSRPERTSERSESLNQAQRRRADLPQGGC
jgi:hypothetical protein